MVDLSIVIPTGNRPDRVRICLERLRSQTLDPSRFEVILVTEDSTDESGIADIQLPFDVRVIGPVNGAPAEAKNRGVAMAAGEFCLFLENDFVASPELAAEHLRLQRERGGAAVIGAITTEIPEGADWFAVAYTRQQGAGYERLGESRQPPNWQHCFRGNLSVPRSAFDALGGFDSSIRQGEDIEFGYRLHIAGIPFVFAPAAKGILHQSSTVSELLRDLESQGRAAAAILSRHPAARSALMRDFQLLGPRTAWMISRLLDANVEPLHIARLASAMPDAARHKGYRLLRNYSFYRGVRDGVGGTGSFREIARGTPILMYHAFAAPGDPVSRYIIGIEEFQRQMAYLERHRYRVLSLTEIAERIGAGEALPARSVALTIDDGYLDNYELAYPVLRRFGFPATIYIVSSRVGGVNDWDSNSPLAGRPLVNWEQAREMAENGIEIGAHTRSHPHLTTIPSDQVQEELAGSKDEIEAALGLPVRHFAYPHGDVDAEVERIAARVGFESSCSVRSGLNNFGDPLHRLYRTEILGTDTLEIFAAKLRTGSSDARGSKERGRTLAANISSSGT